MEAGKLTGLIVGGLIFVAGIVIVCVPFQTSGLIRYYEPEQKLSCRPAIMIVWSGTTASENAVEYACAGPARTRLIFGGGSAALVSVAVGVTAGLLLPRRSTHTGV